MLRITKVESADRMYLKSRQFNPLSKVFNITAKCEKDETLSCMVMCKYCEQTIKAGREYSFRIAYNNILSTPRPKEGDTITLSELKMRKQPLVQDCNVPKKFL